MAAFKANKDFILSQLREVIAIGAFRGQTLNSTLVTVLYKLPLAKELPDFLVAKSLSISHMLLYTEVKRPKLLITLFQKSSIRRPQVL